MSSFLDNWFASGELEFFTTLCSILIISVAGPSFRSAIVFVMFISIV